MEREAARQIATENEKKQPSEYDRQFDALYTNAHFGDVVTEVFGDTILDPHSVRGREILAKYAEVATFLEDIKDDDERELYAVRVIAKSIEYRHDTIPPRQAAKALAIYAYKGLKAESFRAVKDETGAPLGIAIEHPARVLSYGFEDSKGVHEERPYVVIDSIDSLTSPWTRSLTEEETPTIFIVGRDGDEQRMKARDLDETLRMESLPVSDAVLDLQRDAFRVSAGLVTKFTPSST